MNYILPITIACALFLAIILSLAIPLKHSKKVLGWIAVVCALSALGMYGYGYCHKFLSQPSWGIFDLMISILLTVFDTCRIFGGSDNWDAIKDAFNDSASWKVFFLTIQLLALTTSASAVILSLGSKLLKEIRMWGLRTRDIALIYGLDENTLDFGRELVKQEKCAILYVDRSEHAKLQTTINQMGALFRADGEALNGSEKFLRSIGLRPGKRKLHVYALDTSINANQQFAQRLLVSLEARKIRPDQTHLTILSVSEVTDDPMQAFPGRYGYGSVLSVNQSEMAARVLIRSFPPYRSIRFDETGKACNDFHGVIIGFGQTGQAVLRQLVMNSQFYGSNSRIAVFAPDYEKRMGWLSHECGEMLNHYNISFFPSDGRSRQLYDYLEENLSSINYVAISAGSDTINAEIAQRIDPFLQRRNCTAPVLMCSSRGVSRAGEDHVASHRIFTPEILCSDEIDRMAMTLHHSYCKGGDIHENWKHCPYFDRMSSRASADFYDALLYAAGMTREEALSHWDPQGILLDHLAATEHLRWNAFHYCMGFRPMTEDEFHQRAAEYSAQKGSGFRITKDVAQRIHACIIPWENLDAYSEKENRITGGKADYAEHDRINVRELPKVLKAMNQPS